MEIFSFSTRGGGHSNNEDFVLRQRHPTGQGRVICFLADGQGGRPEGDIASKSACEGAMAAALAQSWESLQAPSTWDDIFASADVRVKESCDGFTTLIGLAICPNHIVGASIGDCKAFYAPKAQDAMKELSQLQEKNPPIGAGVNRCTFFSQPNYKGTILVVSDGVWKFANFESVKRLAQHPDPIDIAPLLKNEILARQQSENLPDDFSLITIRN